MSMYDNVTAADMLAVALPEEPEQAPEYNIGDKLYDLAGSLWPHYAESGDATDLLLDVPVFGSVLDMMKYGGTDQEDALGNAIDLALDIPGAKPLAAAIATLPIKDELIRAIKNKMWPKALEMLKSVVTTKATKPLTDEAYIVKGMVPNDVIADKTMRKWGVAPKQANGAIDSEDMGYILNTVAHSSPQGKQMAEMVSKDLLEAAADPTYAARLEAFKQRRAQRNAVAETMQLIQDTDAFNIAHPTKEDMQYAFRLYAQAKRTGQPDLIEGVSKAYKTMQQRYLQGRRK